MVAFGVQGSDDYWSELWRIGLENFGPRAAERADTSLAVGDDATYIVVHIPGAVYCISRDGQLAWQAETGAGRSGPAGMAILGDSVYRIAETLTPTSLQVIRHDIATGMQTRKVPIVEGFHKINDIHRAALMMSQSGSMLVWSGDEQIAWAVDPEGKVVWQTRRGELSEGLPLLRDGNWRIQTRTDSSEEIVIIESGTGQELDRAQGGGDRWDERLPCPLNGCGWWGIGPKGELYVLGEPVDESERSSGGSKSGVAVMVWPPGTGRNPQ